MTDAGAAPALTHFDEAGNALMVDVTEKTVSRRRAVAHCQVREPARADGATGGPLSPELLLAARVAGMFGAKQTSRLIPLCHPLPLRSVEISFVTHDHATEVIAVVETDAQTGVEMEALGACGVAALAIAATLVAHGTRPVIEGLELLEKRGGRSGIWVRDPSAATVSSR